MHFSNHSHYVFLVVSKKVVTTERTNLHSSYIIVNHVYNGCRCHAKTLVNLLVFCLAVFALLLGRHWAGCWVYSIWQGVLHFHRTVQYSKWPDSNSLTWVVWQFSAYIWDNTSVPGGRHQGVPVTSNSYSGNQGLADYFRTMRWTLWFD